MAKDFDQSASPATKRRDPFSIKTIGSVILVVAGCTFTIWLVLLVVTSVFHHFFTRGENLPDLVQQIQADIDTINARNADWKVDEAEVEVSFSLKNTVNGGKELKAVTAEVGTEREAAHKLTLTLRRPQPAPTAAAAPEEKLAHRTKSNRPARDPVPKSEQ